MLKKWIGLLLAILLMTATGSALAATPSKTTEDMTSITEQKTSGTSPSAVLIYIREEPSDMAVSVLKEISAFVASKAAPAGYFTQEVQAEILLRAPEKTDLSTLKMSEFVSLGIADYVESYGDVTCVFQFPTEYAEGQTVVALIGYPDETGTIVWQALDTTVVEGSLRIVFPTDLMLRIGHDAVLAVLSH
jgi:hypothetical protein